MWPLIFEDGGMSPQAWQVRYPQDQGPWRSSSGCAVHHGFLSAWTGHGFNQKLLARMGAILDSSRNISQVGAPAIKAVLTDLTR